MDKTVQKLSCRDCGSLNVIKNGFNICGNQQYKCRDCGASKVLAPKIRYSEAQKQKILRAYKKQGSLRGVSRTFGVSPITISNWLKQSTD